MVHGCMVYTERTEMAAVSCGTSRCKYTTSVDIKKRAIKKLFTHVESHASAVSLLESGEQRYISDHQQQHSEHRFPASSSKICQIWLRH